MFESSQGYEHNALSKGINTNTLCSLRQVWALVPEIRMLVSEHLISSQAVCFLRVLFLLVSVVLTLSKIAI